jgi:hypothetical protein
MLTDVNDFLACSACSPVYSQPATLNPNEIKTYGISGDLAKETFSSEEN